MKILGKVALFGALLGLTMPGLASCKHDSEAEPETPPVESTDENPGATKVEWAITEYRSNTTGNVVLLYYNTDGQVNMAESNGNVEVFNYTDNVITLLGNNSHPCWDLESGLIQNYYDDSADYATYEYNSKHQLTKITSLSEDLRYKYEKELTWEDNSITQVKDIVKGFAFGQMQNETTKLYELKYGNRAAINRECIPTLNRFAMTLIFGLYSPLNMSGCFGMTPDKLIIGCSLDSEGVPNSIIYGDTDANGCPQKVSLKSGATSDELTLKWKKL